MADVTIKGGATYATNLTQAEANAASQLLANSATSTADPDVLYVAGGTATATTEENQAIILSGDSTSTSILRGLFSGDVLVGNNTNDLFEAFGFVKVFGGDGNDTVTDTYKGTQRSNIVLGNGADSVNLKGAASITAGTGNDTLAVNGPSFVTVGGGNDAVSMYGGGLFTETGAGGNDTIVTSQGHYGVDVQGNATMDGIAYQASISGGGVINADFNAPDIGPGLTNRNETIIAHSGNATIVANTGVQMNAGTGNDSLVGHGYDTFAGGLGNSTMTAGVSTNNLFTFNGNGGTDLVKHFQQGTDLVQLQGLTAAQAFADSSYNAGTHSTIITDGATTITVSGVHLTSADFTNG